MDPEITEKKIRVQTLAMLSTSIAFGLALLQICAGTSQVIASYNKFGDPKVTSNLFLAGIVGRCTASGYSIKITSKTAGEKFDQIEKSKFDLHEAIVRASKESTENSKNSNNIQTCQVLDALTTTAARKEMNRTGCIKSTPSSTATSTMEIWTSLTSPLSFE